MKRLVLLIFFLFFLFPQKAIGSFNFYVSEVSPSSVNSSDQEITVHLRVTDLPSESYFRVALQKPSGGSYFGYIQNNTGDWVKIQSLSSDQCSLYSHVTDLSTSDMVIKLRVGDDASVDQSAYKIKAHRFTKTCSSYTEATNSADMVLNFPTPTPTNGPSATSNFTPTKIPTLSPTGIITPKITSKAVLGVSVTDKKKVSSYSASVSDYSKFTPTPKISVAGDTQVNRNRIFLIIILSVGTILFIIAAGLFIKKYWVQIIEWLNT